MNSFNELLKYAGIPNAIILILTFCFALNKIKPVTMITSTYVEKSLQTKEKRLYVKIIRHIGYLLLLFLYQVIITICSYQLRIPFYNFIFYIGFVVSFLGMIISGAIRINKSWFKNFLKKRSLKMKFIVLLLLVFSVLCTITIFPFLIGSGAAFVPGELITDQEKLVVVIIMLFFIACIFLFLFKWEVNSIDLAFSDLKSLFVMEESKKWYIFYPVDDKYFLCGNEPNKQESNVFRYFEKTKLLEKELHICIADSEEEDDIEYII
ncbi:hypothetical protein [Paenibacillus senegalimassiliensis]|uniref:hypothetical protein n=1 Tax=Paenibacillus senegalimassiliensis TaxID=1737426 RepID=UPI00073EA8B0|nr:hypothetical protein [Paenibacillus senegalimassiliensis]